MLSLLTLLPLVGTALSLETSLHTTPQLDPAVPIYLGEVFWPPSMTFIAWLPSEVKTPLEWCYKATECGSGLFSLAGIDALRMHDYFGESASITREGRPYAKCVITPESGRMGACDGVLEYECEGGKKFTGPGTRKWTCWIVPEVEETKGKVVGGAEGEEEGERLTDAMFKPTKVVTGAMSSEGAGVFTAGVTGS